MNLDVLFGAVLLGLGSTLHCAGMCSGIAGAFSMTLDEKVRRRRWAVETHVGLLNLGRLASYGVIGALAGLIGSAALLLVPVTVAHTVLRAAAAVVLVMVGLNVLGVLSRLSVLELIGRPVWRLLEPLGRRLMPVRSPAQALAFGMVWGWLPCGIVYSMLLVAMTGGGALEGAGIMTAFGIGTLPGTLAAGLLARGLVRAVHQPVVRRGLGSALVVMGFVTVLWPPAMPMVFCP